MKKYAPKNYNEGFYKVRSKYCDWSLTSDVCLAQYTNGAWFIQIVGQDDKIIRDVRIIIKMLLEAKSKGSKVPDDLIEKLES